MRSFRPFLLLILAVIFSCGLNNTMYNARKYFRDAQARPLNANGRPTPQAVDEYTKAIKKCGIILSGPEGKNTDDALYLMARALYFKGNSAFQAKDQFEALIKGFPASPFYGESHIFLARVMREINQPEEANKVLERFIADQDNRKLHPRALLTLADFAITDKDYPKAQFWLEKIITDHPKAREFREAYLLFGKNYYVQQNYEASLREFDKIASLRGIPRDLRLDARYYVALNEFELGRLDSSYKRVQKLLREESRLDQLAQLKVLKARLLFADGMGVEGVELAESVTKDYPRTQASSDAQFYLGEYHFYQSKDLDKAVTAYNKVKTEFLTSELVTVSQQKAAGVTQLRQGQNLNQRGNFQQYVDFHMTAAEGYFNEFALADSALAMYQRLIDSRSLLVLERDSLATDLDSVRVRIEGFGSTWAAKLAADSLATARRDSLLAVGDSLITDTADSLSAAADSLAIETIEQPVVSEIDSVLIQTREAEQALAEAARAEEARLDRIQTDNDTAGQTLSRQLDIAISAVSGFLASPDSSAVDNSDQEWESKTATFSDPAVLKRQLQASLDVVGGILNLLRNKAAAANAVPDSLRNAKKVEALTAALQRVEGAFTTLQTLKVTDLEIGSTGDTLAAETPEQDQLPDQTAETTAEPGEEEHPWDDDPTYNALLTRQANLESDLRDIDGIVSRYDREIVPLAKFSQAVVYHKLNPEDPRIAAMHASLIQDFPTSKYTSAVAAMLAGQTVRLVDPAEQADEAELERALTLYEAAPDTMVAILRELTASEYDAIKLKANFRLGWYYAFESPDTTRAKPYLEEVLKLEKTGDYATLTGRFFNGKNFFTNPDLFAAEADSLGQTELPDQNEEKPAETELTPQEQQTPAGGEEPKAGLEPAAEEPKPEPAAEESNPEVLLPETPNPGPNTDLPVLPPEDAGG